ncbi:MAG: hypothetical protein NVS1B13_16960 [Flavisolibacter sp.]
MVPSVKLVEEWLKENVNGHITKFKGYSYTTKLKKYKVSKHLNHTIEVTDRWNQESKLIRQIQKENKIKIDLVFYAWIDNQLAQFISTTLLDAIFPYKWTGLYFHPYHLRLDGKVIEKKANWRDIDSIFLSKKCIGVVVHDTGIINKFSKRIGKPVIHFPETADDTPPDNLNPHALQIKDRSKDRIVVGMIACEKHKGTLTMIRMARDGNSKKYFFAFLGILPKDNYTNDEWVEVQDFINQKKENCYFHFETLTEGAAYNAVFNSFDIPFLIYNNFISSSNRLTKAAIFKKLVLASNNYCVGDDVKKFNLGETVKPNNHKVALDALEKLSQRIAEKNFPEKKWAEYCYINSKEILYKKFEEVINLADRKN